jgi:hypothetical protein
MSLLQTPAPSPPDPVIISQFPFPDPTPPPWVVLHPAVTVLIALAVIAGFVAVFYPLMRAFGRRIEGKIKPDPALLEELDQLRLRVGDLEAQQIRMAELEERVDFTERLLAQKNEPRGLGR